MKKIIYTLIIIAIFLPIKVFALTEDEARKVLVDYSYYVYNNHYSEISYISPSGVNQEANFLGYYTAGNTYAMDCNAFVGFLVYNAFQIQSTERGMISQPAKGYGLLTSTGRLALNGNDGWSTHSSLYDSSSYGLRAGETVQAAVYRIGLQNLLKPGDLIGVVAFGAGSYPNQETSQKNSHIMLYLGDGKYIHNRSGGIGINTLDQISFANRVGSIFPDSRGSSGPHGAITVLRLQNYEQFPNSLINSYRFPDGQGHLVINGGSGETPQNPDNPSTPDNPSNPDKPTVTIPEKGHWEDVKGLHFCEREDTYRLVRLLKIFFIIVQAGIPTLLTISIIIEVSKVLIEKGEMKEVISKSIKKSIAALVAVIIPTFINYVLSLTPLGVTFEKCVEMAKDPKAIRVWVPPKETTSTPTTPTPDTPTTPDPDNATGDKDLEVNKQGIYVVLTSKNATGYYFSKNKESLAANDSRWIASNRESIDFVLLPGTHYVYSRTQDGKVHEQVINVTTSDIVITNDVQDITLLTTSLEQYLAANGSSIQEFNNAIARSVYIAGPYTKEGAAAGALALTQILYTKYKIKIPYGSTHGSHIVLGAPGQWGSTDVNSYEKSRGFYNQGIHCGGFVSWAYTQAGFDMNSGIGSSAQLCTWGYGTLYRITEQAPGQVGDVMTTAPTCNNSKHVAILSALDNNGYYITEANAHTQSVDGVVYLKKNIGIVTTYNPYGSRWSTYLDMTPTISNKKSSNALNSGF